MSFTKTNAVENLVRDLLAGPQPSKPAAVAQALAVYAAAGLSQVIR